MKALAFALGCVCLCSGGIIAVLAIVTLLDERMTPWHMRRPPK
jgi:hypothetical protein